MATDIQPEIQPELPFVSQNASKGEEDEGGRMSFFEHLVELRKRLINSALAVGVGMMIGVAVSNKVFAYMARPMLGALHAAHFEDKLVYTSPTGAISLLINLGLYLGIVIASPVVLYQIWMFIAPGLYRHERRAMSAFIFSSLALFLCGIAFGYYVSLPYVLKFLIGFQGPFKPLISINEYFDLILVVLLGLGVMFELPVLIFCLTLFGIVTPRFLWKNIRYAVLVITLLAAIVTPTPDATTMVLFMGVLLTLYFIGIGVSYMVVRKREKRLAEESGAS
ncbi:MAG TPA: twin-arginine translocase subunit TatC [Candidatus Acidoferrales bacterium]